MHPLEAQRRENREAIRALGVDPYGKRIDGAVTIAEARGMYDAEADAAQQASSAAHKEAMKAAGGSDEGLPAIVDDRARATVVGRVVLKREGGKLIWMQIRDHTSGPAVLITGQDADEAEGRGAIEPSGFAEALVADLQVAVSARDVAEPGFAVTKALDLGDIVMASGPLMRTKAGETTIWADRLELVCKSLTPPPEKWAGVKDIEQRYRRRYMDLGQTPESMQVFKLRSRIVREMRREMEDRGFLEVETPVLQALAGGAAARPFTTHMNALDIDLFMRIAPELYHKRLIVGGMPGVFEFSKNFRNEGLSPRHNPEFTSMEAYLALGDYHSMRELAESLIRRAAAAVWTELHGGSAPLPGAAIELPFGDWVIDYGRPFDTITFSELFEKALGFPMTDHGRAVEEAKTRGFKVADKHGTALDPILVVNELFEEVAEPTLDPSRPTFVFDYPSALSPLTRPKADRPEIAERWDLFIGGMEVGPAYTELNDPDIQAAKFSEQLAGLDDEETTFRNFDQDFIDALKVGMPPAGGVGLGIDRVCMLLLNQKSIRDVILFPMMRPEG